MLKKILPFLFLSVTLLGTPSSEAARQELLEQVAGEWVAHGIYAATELEIPDLLDKSSLSIEEIAEKTHTSPESLYRLMRLLASQGIFIEEEEKIFSHSEKSRLLSKSHPSTLNAITRFYGSLIHESWEGLPASLQSGKPGFEEHFGKPVFLYFRENPSDFSLFHAAMAEKSNAVIASVLERFDFGKYQTVYDIGGGKGHFLWKILEKHQTVKGLLFDLPEVIDGLPSKNHPRCRYAAGDFFEEVPRGGDLYLLKSVIHDWDDEKAKIILSNCCQAMESEGRVLIIEPIIGTKNVPEYAKMMDLLMLNVTGGRERTLEDFAALLKESNLVIEEVVPTSTEFKIIIAKKL